MNSGFWKSDWLLGVLVVVVFTAANLFSDWIPSLERKAYDVALQSTARAPSDRIAIIAIDQASIDNIGRWPWSREVHARMLDLLSKSPDARFQTGEGFGGALRAAAAAPGKAAASTVDIEL